MSTGKCGYVSGSFSSVPSYSVEIVERNERNDSFALLIRLQTCDLQKKEPSDDSLDLKKGNEKENPLKGKILPDFILPKMQKKWKSFQVK